MGARGRLRPKRRKDQISAVAPWSASETGVDLEFHQLDCRYERCGCVSLSVSAAFWPRWPTTASRFPSSSCGAATYVVVDGHKRVRCLKRFHRDSIAGVVWEMSEPDALIFRQTVHGEGSVSALEQGWLLRALHEAHDLRLPDLARRFDRSVSWVSRRLGLARELPEAIQDRVREGRIVPTRR